jgi:hypothetical protein
VPPLAEYFRGGLRVVAEPGTTFAYSSHGFATLGQIIEDVSGMAMFEPHHRPDPRLLGWGLGFALAEAGTHRMVGHDGILPGFNSELLVAPDDGLGVIAFTNGSKAAFMWMETEFKRLLRHLLEVPDEVVRTDIPHHPEVWEELCGRYRLPPRISDLRQRLLIAGGAEVFVRGGRLMIRWLAPIPALYRGLPLHPDDEDDPYVFRLDLSRVGDGDASRCVRPRRRKRRAGHPPPGHDAAARARGPARDPRAPRRGAGDPDEPRPDGRSGPEPRRDPHDSR